MLTFNIQCAQWCIAKNGGGYTQRGVAKGLKVPCLFMITEVSIRCQKKPGGWYTAYTHVYPPNTPLSVLLGAVKKLHTHLIWRVGNHLCMCEWCQVSLSSDEDRSDGNCFTILR